MSAVVRVRACVRARGNCESPKVFSASAAELFVRSETHLQRFAFNTSSTRSFIGAVTLLAPCAGERLVSKTRKSFLPPPHYRNERKPRDTDDSVVVLPDVTR